MANNSDIKYINIVSMFSDIGASVNDIERELNYYKNVYEETTDPVIKVKVGKGIVDLITCKIGFLTLIINDDEFLAIDLAALIPICAETVKFIEEMEDIAESIEDTVKRAEALSHTLQARVKLYDTKVFFYRFVDLSSMGGYLL